MKINTNQIFAAPTPFSPGEGLGARPIKNNNGSKNFI
jgi:hypothetical protein